MKINAHIEITPEMQEAERVRQSIARKALLPRILMSADEQVLARAMARTRSLKDTLKLLRKPYDERQIEYDAEAKRQTQIDLAEAYSEQGMFKKASHVAPTNELRAYYERIERAVWRDDAKECDCPADVSGSQIVTNRRIVRRVFSEKHAKFMNLIECVRCGFWNVRELTADLARLEAARGRAEQVMRANPENLQQALKENNLLDSMILR